MAHGGLARSSHDSSDPAHLEFQLKQDGYESGDLGDVSHACYTDDIGGVEDDEREGVVGDSERTKKIGGHAKKIDGRHQKHQHSSRHGLKDDKPGIQGGGGGGVISQTCELVNPGSDETSEVVVTLPSNELVQEIIQKMWRYCHAYHINNSVSKCVWA